MKNFLLFIKNKITLLKILDWIISLITIILALIINIDVYFRIMMGIFGIVLFFKHDKWSRIVCIGGTIFILLYIHVQIRMAMMEMEFYLYNLDKR